jgi:hypothetical protein
MRTTPVEMKTVELRAVFLMGWIALLAIGCAGRVNAGASLVTGATGSATGPSGSPSPTSALQEGSVDPNAGFDEGFIQDWDNPIEGVRVDTTADAANNVAFDVQEPGGLGTPLAIYTSGEELDKSSRAVAFVYDTAAFGRVDILEHLPESSGDDYQKFLVSLNGDPLTHGRADLVTIRGSIQALVTTSEDGGHCAGFWLEGGIEYIVEGPVLTFDDVTKAAELV